MWKIIGIIESRTGEICILPEWAIGSPNEFDNLPAAERAAAAMQQVIVQRSGEGDRRDKTALRYMVLPAIDPTLHDQLRATGPSVAPPPPPSGTPLFPTKP